MMRVITGSAKGRRLRSVPGDSTRPITDRVKAALFDTLGTQVIDCRFLDVFAGTGSVGIEALSRGAAEAVFVDISRAALKTIEENLRLTGLRDQGHVVRADAFDFLQRPGLDSFDIIYIAPPQYQGLWEKAVLAVDGRPELLVPEGLAIAQIFPKEREELVLEHLQLVDERQYGSTLLLYWTL